MLKQNSNGVKKFLAICLLILVLLPGITLAQEQTPNACSGSNAPSITRCVNQIYIWSMGIAALLALFMIIIGGYLTLTSAGNAQRASAGKSYITSSLIGLALLFGAFLLLRTINPDLVDFSQNCLNKPDCLTPTAK